MAEQPRKRVIVVSRPTPNGPLHLGHLAGPYLRADILRRASRLQGWTARMITGLDAHQNYMRLAAELTGCSVQTLVETHGAQITQALSGFQIQFDNIWQPCGRDRGRLVAAAQRLVKRIAARGGLVLQTLSVPVIADEGLDAYEAFIGGSCAHCGEPTSGNGCESCGIPTLPWLLKGPAGSNGHRITWEDRSIAMFRIGHGAAELMQVIETGTMPDWQRTLLNRMVAVGPELVPLGYRNNWGLGCPPLPAGHVLHTPFESAAILADELRFGRGLGPRDECISFHGFDNIFNSTVLVPAALTSAGLRKCVPGYFIANHFYRLDGTKFSTSRGHAVWALDALKMFGVDALRLYLAQTAPEKASTDFTVAGLRGFISTTLAEGWGLWLRAEAQRQEARPMGEIVIDDLQVRARLEDLWRSLAPATFSASCAFSALDGLVSALQARSWLGAAGCFAAAASPLAPVLAKAFAAACGLAISQGAWPETGRLVIHAQARKDASALKEILDSWNRK